MKADPDDRIQGGEAPAKTFPVRSLAAALAILVLMAVAWFLVGEVKEEVAPREEPVEVEPATPLVQEEAPKPVPVLEPAPDIPERPETGPEEPAEPVEPPPLPLSLMDSDPVIREELQAASDANLFEGMLMSENLVQRSTAMVDGFSRGLVLNKVLPFAAPKPAFKASGQGDHLYMGPDNYVRFNWVAETLARVKITTLVDVFHEHRGLFEEAYAELGYPGEQFDNAVIRALDLVLATPEIERPIALERKKVFYTYYDPDLEALPALQKQLLRMGPDNLRKVKDWAHLLRGQLLNQ